MQVKDNRTKKYITWHCSDEILFETWFGEVLGYAFFKKDAFQSLSIYVWFILSRTHSIEPHMAPSLWDVTAQRGFLLVARVLRITIPWPFKLTSGGDKKISPDCTHHACSFLNRLSNCHKSPSLFLYSPFLVPHVWSQMQHCTANAVQVDKTVAEPESLKKLLIIWLMCIRLWEWEINHQQWDELLKWILVFCLLSFGNGFSFLHHQVNRCGDAVFSFSQSQ